MHEYTKKQKYAIAYILMQIIEADAIVHPKEIEYFKPKKKDKPESLILVCVILGIL